MRPDCAGSIPVTVVVPVRNEERGLAHCLERLQRFREVVVADSASTDATAEIATRWQATLIQFEWNGGFPKKRNWVLMHHRFTTDWVLFLDADEVVDDRFCNELAAAIKSGRHNGYWLNYTNHFLGKRLRHGVPQRKLALFKIGCGSYERIEEDRWSGLDMEVHEHPIVEGTIGEIAAPIDHQDFRGLDAFLIRHVDYAKWEARRYLALEVQGQQTTARLTGRQRFKYRHLERWWYPTFYFCFAYFVKLGLLDGRAGLSYAFYKAWYFQTIRLLIRELRASGGDGSDGSSARPVEVSHPTPGRQDTPSKRTASP